MEFAIEHGFQGIEIWSNVFDFWPKTVSVREIDAITALARENHVSLAMHFCAGNNLADINEGHLRERSGQKFSLSTRGSPTTCLRMTKDLLPYIHNLAQ
jgi:sugar phosphate isomerase/epimerase